MVLEELARLVRHVEYDVVDAAPLQFEVDGTRDRIARGELAARVVFEHEAVARRHRLAGFRRNAQDAPFAAQRLADQEGLHLRVIQAGRMELHELHIRDPAAGAPGHGDAVARRRIRIGRVEIDLAGAARCQHDMAGRQGHHFVSFLIERVQAVAAAYIMRVERNARRHEPAAGDQVDRGMPFKHRDIGVLAHLGHQRFLNGMARGVGCVHDARMAVAALAVQLKARHLLVAGARERYAFGNQPFDRGRRPFNDELDGLRIVQPGAGDHGVVDMRRERILRVDDGRNAALRPIAGASQQGPLGDDGYLPGP